jgi:hypothetical protein
MLLANGEVFLTKHERKALFWLYHMCSLGKPEYNYSFKRFCYLAAYIEMYGNKRFYAIAEENVNSKKRTWYIPCEELKLIQKRIDVGVFNRILPYFEFPNSFGFLKGSCYEALNLHRQAKSFLTYDLKDAFYQVSDFSFLHRSLHLTYRLDMNDKWKSVRLFSWNVSTLLILFCLYLDKPDGRDVAKFRGNKVFFPYFHTKFLPQGASTSPKIFELFMRRIDRTLYKKSEKLHISYSRYADNFFFGSSESKFPEKISSAFIHDVSLPVHKVKVIHEKSTPMRALNYNISTNCIQGTADFLNKVRKSIHHLEKTYQLFQKGEIDKEVVIVAWNKMNGLLSYIRSTKFPQFLINKIDRIEDIKHSLFFECDK